MLSWAADALKGRHTQEERVQQPQTQTTLILLLPMALLTHRTCVATER